MSSGIDFFQAYQEVSKEQLLTKGQKNVGITVLVLEIRHIEYHAFVEV